MDVTRQMIEHVRGGEKKLLLDCIKNGGDPKVILSEDDKNAAKGSLLSLAASLGHSHLILPLIEAGIAVDYTGNQTRTALHEAAAAGHLEAVKILLAEKADLEATSQNDNGSRPLHMSCRAGQTSVVLLLLEMGADKEAGDKDGWTPLHEAAYHGHVDIMKILIESGVNIEAEAFGGWTALHRASLWGHKDAVKLLLDSGADSDHPGVFDTRAVHYAACRGHINVLEIFDRYGVNLGALDRNKGNPIHSAAGAGRLATIVWLVEHGVKHNLKDRNNRSPEDMGQLYGYHHVAYWLHKQNVEDEPREHTQMEISQEEYERIGVITESWAKEGKVFFIRNHLRARPYRIHYQDKNGWTPLHHAAFNNQVEASKALLENGALRSGSSCACETPADIAKAQGHLELYDILKITIPATTRTQRVQMYGRLLREISCAEFLIHGSNEKSDMESRHNVVKRVSSLIDNGTPLEPVGGHSTIALHLAITSNCTDLLPLLLSAGAPLTTTTSGMSVLQLSWLSPDVTTHIAVMVTRAFKHQLAHELTQVGSEKPEDEKLKEGIENILKVIQGKEPWTAAWPVDVRDIRKLTNLLVRACRWGITLTASFLQKAGGSVTALDVSGTTAIHSALDHKHISTAKSLIHHMKANIFLEDSLGRFPVQLLPEKERQHVMEETLSHEYRKLVMMKEKTRDEEEKHLLSCIIILLAVLYIEDEIITTTSVEGTRSLWREVFGDLILLMKVEKCDGDDEVTNSKWLISLVNDIKSLFSKGKTKEIEVDEIPNSQQSLQVSNDDDEEFETEEEYFFLLIDVLRGKLLSNSDRNIHAEAKTESEEILLKASFISSESNMTLFLHLLLTVGGRHPDDVLNKLCGSTALHLAAWRGHMGLCDYLLRQKANNSLIDQGLNTPAHLAFMFGHTGVGNCLLNGVETWKNRAGRMPQQLNEHFKKYCLLYGVDKTLKIKVHERNDPVTLTRLHLKQFKKCWPDISLAVKKLHVDFTKGEAQEIKQTLSSQLKRILEKVSKINPLFDCNLVVLGSSADNLRLFAPDEFDCNVELNNVSDAPGGGLQVEVVPVPPSDVYKGHKNCLRVLATNEEVSSLITGSNFGDTFSQTVMEALNKFQITDHRLNIVPPGVKKTQVGVNMSFSWEGTEFPLLFIDVDFVPVVKAKWPVNEPKPSLTPQDLDTVNLSNTGKDEWRYSFAVAENRILVSLCKDRRRAFLACKLLITSLKTESWAPREFKDYFTYWNGHRFKIPAPPGFILKSAFMKEMEEVVDDRLWEKPYLHERMCAVFRRMCKVNVNSNDGKNEYYHAKMKPYFGGDTEKPSVGLGAPEILKFLDTWNLGDETDVK